MNTLTAPGRPLIALAVNLAGLLALRSHLAHLDPDARRVALLAEQGGADSIILPIGEGDDRLTHMELAEIARSLCTPLCVELPFNPAVLQTLAQLRPDRVYLTRAADRSIGARAGLDVARGAASIERATASLRAAGVQVCPVVEPELSQIDAVLDTGASIVQLDTRGLAAARGTDSHAIVLDQIRRSAAQALGMGLEVCAGGALDRNDARELAASTEIGELHIGHAIAAQALFEGLEKAVRETKAVLYEARLQAHGLRR